MTWGRNGKRPKWLDTFQSRFQDSFRWWTRVPRVRDRFQGGLVRLTRVPVTSDLFQGGFVRSTRFPRGSVPGRFQLWYDQHVFKGGFIGQHAVFREFRIGSRAVWYHGLHVFRNFRLVPGWFGRSTCFSKRICSRVVWYHGLHVFRYFMHSESSRSVPGRFGAVNTGSWISGSVPRRLQLWYDQQVFHDFRPMSVQGRFYYGQHVPRVQDRSQGGLVYGQHVFRDFRSVPGRFHTVITCWFRGNLILYSLK